MMRRYAFVENKNGGHHHVEIQQKTRFLYHPVRNAATTIFNHLEQQKYLHGPVLNGWGTALLCIYEYMTRMTALSPAGNV
jgi:hypothetical protein